MFLRFISKCLIKKYFAKSKYDDVFKIYNTIHFILAINTITWKSRLAMCLSTIYCLCVCVTMVTIFFIEKGFRTYCLEYFLVSLLTLIIKKSTKLKYYRSLESTDKILQVTSKYYEKLTKKNITVVIIIVLVRIIYTVSYCIFASIAVCTPLRYLVVFFLIHLAVDLNEIGRTFPYCILTHRMALLRRCIEKKYSNTFLYINNPVLDTKKIKEIKMKDYFSAYVCMIENMQPVHEQNSIFVCI